MYICSCQVVHVSAAKKKWTIATARQHLPEVVGLAAHEPQRVYRRERLVAAVVSPELADQIEQIRRPSLATKLAELQRLCGEENYELDAPPRQDRVNPFAARPARGGPRRPPGRKR
jgi:hypothetical protein